MVTPKKIPIIGLSGNPKIFQFKPEFIDPYHHGVVWIGVKRQNSFSILNFLNPHAVGI